MVLNNGESTQITGNGASAFLEVKLTDQSSSDATGEVTLHDSRGIVGIIANIKHKMRSERFNILPPITISFQSNTPEAELESSITFLDNRATQWQSPYGTVFAELPDAPHKAKMCIATVTTASHIPWLHMMASSLYDFGDVKDAMLCVLGFGLSSEECQFLKKTYNAIVVPCRLESGGNGLFKPVTLAIPYIVDASSYLIIDTDIFVAKSMRSMLEEVANSDKIHAVIDGVRKSGQGMDWDISSLYKGNHKTNVFKKSFADGLKFKSINSGVYFAKKESLMRLESYIKSFMPLSADFEQSEPLSKFDVYYREQFFVSLALHEGNLLKLINPEYNAMPFCSGFAITQSAPTIQAVVGDKQARAIHFNSPAMRQKYGGLLKDYKVAPKHPKLFRGEA